MSGRTSDVVVVGGGIVGAACAYYLARADVSVTLCERDDLAVGASGRNPGFVWMHTRRPGAQLELARLGRRLYDSLEAELEREIDFRPNGGLIFFHSPEQRKVMEEFVEERRSAGVDVELLDGDEARSLAPVLGEDVIGASYCREDAQITTAKVVEAFAAAAERLGARILRGAEVLEVRRTARGGVAGVTTTSGRVDAGGVVLATGVWAPALGVTLGLDLPIRPMRLQVVATGVRPPELDVLLYGPSAIPQYDVFASLPSFDASAFSDDGTGRGLPFLELACQTREGRFLLGCPIDMPPEPVWEPDLAGVGLICRSLPARLPALSSATFERAWAGCLPHTPDSLPVVDAAPDAPGLFVAAGHVFGNAAGPATGVLVSELVRGERPSIDARPFAYGRESLRASGAEATTW
jgi:glycine/D-amino acid oxidase-like deaminating enzyme